MLKVIIVTGGCGFIGSNLVLELLTRTDTGKIIVIDNFCSGQRCHIPKHDRVIVVEGDISSTHIPKCDEIYHLACPASPKFYQRNDLETIATCYEGTLNVLKYAHEYNAKVVFTSTSEVYGDPEENPQSESYRGNVSTVGIRSCYDEGKRIAETLCFSYKRMHNTDIRVARIFNSFGPGMRLDDGRVLTNFIHQAQQGKPITVYGDGSQTRTFCYVDDTVQGLLKLMETGNALTTPVNIGNPNDTVSMRDLANRVVELTNSKSDVVFLDLPLDDPRCRTPDISLARKVLEWEPQVEFKKGLQLMVDYVSTTMKSSI
jgi:UDP-glucuronate decarboxylase